MREITYQGKVVALVDAGETRLMPEIERLRSDHPVRRFVAFLCVYGADAANAGGYPQERAEALGRRVLMPLRELLAELGAPIDELVELFGVPAEQVELRLRELPFAWPPPPS